MLAENLKKCRQEKGLSRDTLAHKVGITTGYVISLENKKRNPSIDVVVKLASALEVSLDELILGEQKVHNK